jgi:DNA polymerase III alpha subunit
MGKMVVEVIDYVVTDSGQVVGKYNMFLDRTRQKQDRNVSLALPSLEITKYNNQNLENPITTWLQDGVEGGPTTDIYEFDIPDQYHELDLDEFLAVRLAQRFPDTPEKYSDRLATELQMSRECNMEGFLRAMIYVVDEFEKHGVIYGVDQGSSSASFILFWIGVHLVDPVE